MIIKITYLSFGKYIILCFPDRELRPLGRASVRNDAYGSRLDRESRCQVRNQNHDFHIFILVILKSN
jgi:hypothetical protein